MNKEITFNDASNINIVVDELKENFKQAELNKEEFGVIIRFVDTITEADLSIILTALWKFEVETKHTIDILIKNLSYDLRKYALGLALKTEDLINPIFLTNIFCLIKGHNTFAETYFEHEQVFLNDEVELLDIFDDLEKEIQVVTLKLAEYYVSMLKTCNLMEAATNNPNAVKLENLYVFLFNSMDVTCLANVLSTVKDPSIWETKKIVINSLNYLCAIAEKFVFTNKMLGMIDFEALNKE